MLRQKPEFTQRRVTHILEYYAALDHFDQSARRAGIARTYRKNLLDEPEAEEICYARMADHASGETLKALHRLSHLN